MNIEDLKNTWNEDTVDETPEINIEQKNKVNLPLEKLRKNMRMEFYSTVVILIFGFYVVWVPIPETPFKFKFYFTVLLASMVIVTGFFFSKFFKLYQEISNPLMNTYDSLKDLMHQFELNKQYYLSFLLSFVPFLVCELIIVIEFLPPYKPISNFKIVIIVIPILAFGLFALLLLGKFWYQYFYGKYVKQIEALILEFKSKK